MGRQKVRTILFVVGAVFLSSLAVQSSASANVGNDLGWAIRVAPNTTMYAGDVVSNERDYQLEMRGDGVLQLTHHGHSLWERPESGAVAGSRFSIQDDGNLVIYKPGGGYTWTSWSHDHPNVTGLYLQDDGNVVLYETGNVPVWWTGTEGKMAPAPPTERLNWGVTRIAPGTNMYAGQQLSNPQGDKLSMGKDGILSLSHSGTEVWSVPSSGAVAGSWLSIQDDGNLVIYKPGGGYTWTSWTDQNPDVDGLYLNDLGNLILYRPGGIVEWETETTRPTGTGALNAVSADELAIVAVGNLNDDASNRQVELRFVRTSPGARKTVRTTVVWASGLHNTFDFTATDLQPGVYEVIATLTRNGIQGAEIGRVPRIQVHQPLGSGSLKGYANSSTTLLAFGSLFDGPTGRTVQLDLYRVSGKANDPSAEIESLVRSVNVKPFGSDEDFNFTFAGLVKANYRVRASVYADGRSADFGILDVSVAGAPAATTPCRAKFTASPFEADAGDNGFNEPTSVEGYAHRLTTTSNANFQRLVNAGSITEDWHFYNGDSMSSPNAARRVASGEPIAGYRQTRYFEITPCRGDGLIAMDFVITNEISGGIIKGDDRPLNFDVIGTNKDPSTSRVVVLLDREKGRGLITLSDSTIVVLDVEAMWTRGIIQNKELWTLPALPVEFEPFPIRSAAGVLLEGRASLFSPLGHGLIDYNAISLESSKTKIRLDYDMLNSITAQARVFSVDGPIELHRQPDGSYSIGGQSDADTYPSIMISQYLPDGTIRQIWKQEQDPVFPGSFPGSLVPGVVPVAGGYSVLRQDGY